MQQEEACSILMFTYVNAITCC